MYLTLVSYTCVLLEIKSRAFCWLLQNAIIIHLDSIINNFVHIYVQKSLQAQSFKL